MLVVVLLLAVVVVLLAVTALILRSRLVRERTARIAADELAERRADEIAAGKAALDNAEQQRAAADARAASAEERALEAEADRRLKPFASGGPELDPHVLWALERSRSERTWRLSVAAGPDVDSVFAEAPDALTVALQIEIDATREEIGTAVVLDSDLNGPVTASGAVLVLRTAQELLAGVARRSEDVTLRLRADGGDVLVTVHAIDELEREVEPAALAVGSSHHVEPIEHGIRVRGALAVDAARV